MIDEWPPEPKLDLPDLEAGKVYSAQLIWRRKGYRGKELKQYYIKPDNQKNTNFYADKELKEFQGRYPLHWFADFKLIEDIEEQLVELVEEPTNFEQMSLFEVI
ncbi:sugar ABC transporter [Bacillus sp. Hm123]|uniref:sugar ABC transporter n=1 Tax=Bacillus sp. Hm123 TaxID=3450745 RepID=UPI003F43743A